MFCRLITFPPGASVAVEASHVPRYCFDMMRHLTSLLLSFVLVLTSHSAAMARGSSTAVDQMVICSGTTVITVYVDRDGQPTEAPHLCPDCALHLLAAALPPVAVINRAFVEVRAYPWQPRVRDGGSEVSLASARAPPVLI